ncbi:MAG: mechanosensitive ion channel family protein [Bacteroidota bacterium]
MQEFIEQLFEKIITNSFSEIEYFFSLLPNFIIAVLCILLFSLLGKQAANLAGPTLEKYTQLRKSLVVLLLKAVRLTFIAIGLITSLNTLHLEKAVASLLAGAGIIGLALGFVFKDITANLMAGVMMSIKGYYNIGDYVQIQDYFGRVKQVDLRHTTIEIPQGQEIVIPNIEIYQHAFSKFSIPQRRIDLPVGVSYSDDLTKVKATTLEAINRLSFVAESPQPQVFFTDFGDSSINFKVTFWIPFKHQKDFMEARSEAIMMIKAAFDSEAISIPFPIRTLELSENSVALLSKQPIVS